MQYLPKVNWDSSKSNINTWESITNGKSVRRKSNIGRNTDNSMWMET